MTGELARKFESVFGVLLSLFTFLCRVLASYLEILTKQNFFSGLMGIVFFLEFSEILSREN